MATLAREVIVVLAEKVELPATAYQWSSHAYFQERRKKEEEDKLKRCGLE